MGLRAFKRQITEILNTSDLPTALETIKGMPQEKILNPIFSCLCSCNEVIKWHGVSAIGQVIAGMADRDMESARIVMRRFMWMLNDESGGIGWGVPEAFAEVCANHPKIAQEYTHILISFMREDGFYLELPQLQRGLLWGIGRLAQVYPDLLLSKNVLTYLSPYLDSSDLIVLAGTVYASGLLLDEQSTAKIQALTTDSRSLTLYRDREFITSTLGTIASEALAQLLTKQA